MSWIYKKKKKEISDEQKVHRGLFMLSLLGIGFLYVVVTKPDNSVNFNKSEDPTEIIMDKTVDSLLKERFPEGYTILDKGELENSYSEIRCNQDEELHSVEYELEIYRQILDVAKGKHKRETKEKIDSLKDLKRILELQVEDFKGHPSAKLDKKARRLKIATNDGKIWTGFQELMLGLSGLNYLIEITDSKTAMEELEIIASKDTNALRKLINSK